MALIEQVSNYIEKIPVIWREDFCLLIEGKSASPEFIEFFNSNIKCRQIAERVIRLVDHDFAVELAESQAIET